MGLLDSLLYNQSGYGGQGGGLLDMLQNSLMQQNSYQPSAGFPQQQPGNPDQFQPQQAMTPPNAQPAQGQIPQAPTAQPQQAPAFGQQGEGPITTGLRALGNPGGLINKVADAVQGFSTGQSPTQRQQSQLFQAYVGAGLSPRAGLCLLCLIRILLRI
jgi:hypothetical protein